MPSNYQLILTATALKHIKDDMFLMERLMRSMDDGLTDDVICPQTSELLGILILRFETAVDLIDKALE
jgi:hypothetical protein|tara:strand:- start:205 stop:408 length:204 start_codon:yes stop_codon:yes gene_type:complete